MSTAAAQTDTRARDTLIDPRDLTVTSHMVDFAQTADNLTLFCCVILNEAPPAPQVYFHRVTLLELLHIRDFIRFVQREELEVIHGEEM